MIWHRRWIISNAVIVFALGYSHDITSPTPTDACERVWLREGLGDEQVVKSLERLVLPLV